MPKVVAVINPDGSIKKLDFEGYEGATCIDVDDKLRALMSALGVKVEETNFVAKPELTQTQEQQFHSQKQSGEA